MSPQTWRVVIAIVLIVHGIGHWMGIMSAVGLIKSTTWHSKSWLLTDVMGDTAARAVSVVLWSVALVGSIAAGLGVADWLIPQEWWRALAVVAAIASLMGLVLFWNALAALFNKIGALGVNIAILVCVIGAGWPSKADFGF